MLEAAGKKMSVINQPVVSKGQHVLVKCAKKQRVSYYAGQVTRVDKREDEVQTTYLKRNDMHKSDAVTSCWPEIEDLAWHDEQDIIAKLPEPTQLVTQLARPTNCVLSLTLRLTRTGCFS